MTTPSVTPGPTPTPPALSVLCDGFSLRQVNPSHAVVVLRNALVHAELAVTAEGLRQIAAHCDSLADQLTPEPAQLVTPEGAGRIVLPGAGR